MKKIYWFWSAVLLMAVVISACGKHRKVAYEEYHKMDSLVWKRFDNQIFKVDNLKKGVAYDVYFQFRHLPDYPYKRFFCTVAIFQPDGNLRAQEYTMWLKKSGVWVSDCMGDLCDFSYRIKKRFQINKEGTYTFNIENRMPKSVLPGVVEVGLLIKESPPRKKRVKDE